MDRILVTGAGGSAAYNFIDALNADKTFKHWTLGTDCSAFRLKLSNADEVQLMPRADDPTYIQQLNQLIEKYCIDLVHPQPDVEVLQIAKNRDRQSGRLGTFDWMISPFPHLQYYSLKLPITKAKTFLPTDETIRLCQDKLATNTTLKARGISVPDTIAVGRFAPRHKADYPRKVQGRWWLRARAGAGSSAALPVFSRTEVDWWMNYHYNHKGFKPGDFILSEYLPGREYAWTSLWRDGELLTSMGRQRLEYLHGRLRVSGQSSSPSVALSVHDDRVNQLGHDAVKAVDDKATGVFCIDMKENKQGQPAVTEINAGRFFTTSNFFARIGANIPVQYVKVAMGEDPGSLKKFNAGQAGKYFIREMDMLARCVDGPST